MEDNINKDDMTMTQFQRFSSGIYVAKGSSIAKEALMSRDKSVSNRKGSPEWTSRFDTLLYSSFKNSKQHENAKILEDELRLLEANKACQNLDLT